MQRLIGIFLLLSLPLVSSCSEISGGPVEGTVVERLTGKPIEGATVVVKWYASMTGMSAWYPCYHVELATSDKDGRFQVPKWSVDASAEGAAPVLKNLNYFRMSSIDKPIQTHIYKPGYEGAAQDWRKREDPIIPMSPFKGTPSERVGMLYQLSHRIEDCVDTSRVLHLKIKIYEEAKSQALTDQDAKLVEGLLTGIETIQYGPKEAMRHGTERDKLRSREKKQ